MFLENLSKHYIMDLFYGHIKYLLSKIKFYNTESYDQKEEAIKELEKAFNVLKKITLNLMLICLFIMEI